MIRNIIFDVGKVLVSYEPDAYMQRLGISKENQKKINEAMFQNKLWDTSDQGLGTPDEFLQKFIAGAPELADEITIKPSEIPWNCSRMPWNGFSI
jgi:putative hydrolase of the HAD superfamily